MLLQSKVLTLLLCGQFDTAPFGRKQGVLKQLSDAAPYFVDESSSQTPAKTTSEV